MFTIRNAGLLSTRFPSRTITFRSESVESLCAASRAFTMEYPTMALSLWPSTE